MSNTSEKVDKILEGEEPEDVLSERTDGELELEKFFEKMGATVDSVSITGMGPGRRVVVRGKDRNGTSFYFNVEERRQGDARFSLENTDENLGSDVIIYMFSKKNIVRFIRNKQESVNLNFDVSDETFM